jgi:hypothetical protein
MQKRTVERVISRRRPKGMVAISDLLPKKSSGRTSSYYHVSMQNSISLSLRARFSCEKQSAAYVLIADGFGASKRAVRQ